MSTCDYCPAPALWLVTAETATVGMTRLACQADVDRARRDCSTVTMPTITAVPAERPWTHITPTVARQIGLRAQETRHA